MCAGGCNGGGTTGGRGRSASKSSSVTGHRPLSYTKKISLPTSKPKVKFGSIKFGSKK